MAGYCSLVILCIGAAAALSAMALVAIAAFTDHWVEVETIFSSISSTNHQMNISAQVLVDREVVKEVGRGDEQEIVFFSRHRGLFRVCFPGTEQGEYEESSQNNDFENDMLEQFL